MKPPRPLDQATFQRADRDFGILPFWFLNGELDPEEMRIQLEELRDKGMQGVVFHGRYGLEMPYLSQRYLDRIRFGVEEANRLGLAAWIYDEMNWPSGTADKRVLKERPTLAQRYLECVSFSVRGPWFMCLTGEDSRYLDFQGSTPVAVFAVSENGRVIDLTSNLSFKKVIPWEVPPGRWQICYIVEKRADYYIDALDPESTQSFLRLGYEPYVETLWNGNEGLDGRALVGFYSDEPAMHYFLTARDNPIVPWTKDMFRRFQERNGYDLRSRLLDLFLDLHPAAAVTRHDFYSTTTELYSDAYYRQIHDWCRQRGVIFTAHLLYEEWIRQMVRVEGNPFRHYEHMDIVAVDHLYPVIGTRESPDQHVAIKLASSAAHHFGSERLICESFGGIFMDATMQRMKWIADWEYVLGVNVLNPHGFHYTFEGHRKRDWPPSMFYQYPWWRYYGGFSDYMSRTSEMLTGGKHVAKVAVLWPINAMFAAYLPSERTPEGDMIEAGLNLLTDLLLRLHHDFDYLDEEVLAAADIADGKMRIGEEAYELVIIPPMTHIRDSSVDALERFVAAGGRVLGVLSAPVHGLGSAGLSDVESRVAALLGATLHSPESGYEVVRGEHARGAGAFVGGDPTVLSLGPGKERDGLGVAVDRAVRSLIEPDVEISNPDVFVLHRRKDDSDVFFVVNTTFDPQPSEIKIAGKEGIALWDPVSGAELSTAARALETATAVDVTLPPVGSLFVITGRAALGDVDRSSADGRRRVGSALRWSLGGPIQAEETIELGDFWTFEREDDNALVVKSWRASPEEDGGSPDDYAGANVDAGSWTELVAGAWAYQLEAEPDRPWPIPVWYRISFDVADVPERLCLLVDGFDGDDMAVWCNGRRVVGKAVRSRIDAQMQELDICGLVRVGRNVLAIRLDLRDPTCGLVDHIKLVGDFTLEGDGGSYRIVAGHDHAEARPWTEQGHPFFSGRGVYTTSFELSEEAAGCRLLLEVPMHDDVLEVEVNGRSAGICLWEPYVVDVTSVVRPGENRLRLRVANTPANLLNGDPRPSGLRGKPRLFVDPLKGGPFAADTTSAQPAVSR